MAITHILIGLLVSTQGATTKRFWIRKPKTIFNSDRSCGHSVTVRKKSGLYRGGFISLGSLLAYQERHRRICNHSEPSEQHQGHFNELVARGKTGYRN